LAPRVFRIVDGDKLEWCNRQEWHSYGWNRARSYGHCLPASALVYC
jgi:hypothetical protein